MSTTQAAIYARVSSERQATAQTIASQLAALRERVTVDGYVVPEAMQFLDDGYSGTTLVRPALERLRDLVAAGAVVCRPLPEETAQITTDAGRVAAPLQDAPQRLENFITGPQCLGEGGGAERHDHELLEVDARIGVRAAIQDVHHRDRERVRVVAVQLAEMSIHGGALGRRLFPWDRTLAKTD